MAATVVVSIGRNVGRPEDEARLGASLDDEQWTLFKYAVADAIFIRSGGRVHFEGEGTGYFEGTSERSFTIVATVENPVGLYHDLAELAPRFGQQSIALTTGNTAFPGGE